MSSDIIQQMPISLLKERKAKIEATWVQFDEIQIAIELAEDLSEI